MIMLFAAAAAAASAPAATSALDRVRPGFEAIPRERAAPRDPETPRGLDLRDNGIELPEVELALLDSKVGPVLRVGALGGRHNAAPKLAHVAVGWNF